MQIDLRQIPSFVIARERTPEQLKIYRPTGIIAGLAGRTHLEDCTFNHAAAIYAGMCGKQYPFCVFEEDAWPTEWHQFEIDVPDCDVCKLDLSTLGRWGESWLPNVEYEEHHGGTIRVFNMLSSAAYLVTNEVIALKLYHRLSEGASIGVASDVVFIPLMKHYVFLALKKPLFYQGPTETNPNAQYTNWCIEDAVVE
jgi:hypothetical protein